MKWARLVVIGLALGCSGCLGLAGVTRALEERHVTSCIYITGFFAPFVLQRIITATGGATVAQCHELR